MNAIISIHNRLQNIVPVEKRSKPLAFFLVLLGTSMDNINVTGAITSFFSIYESFDANSTTVSWTLSAYALTLGAFIMLAGKMTDIIGAHRVFLLAVSTTALFALICAVIKNSIIALIVFRAFQGVSAAFLIPSSFAVAANYFPNPKHFMMALIGLMLTLTGTFGLGLVLGGVFSITNVGYKGLYYFTFSLGCLITILLYLLMVPVEPTEEHKNLKLRNLDFWGSAMFVVGTLLVILAFTESGESWNRPSVYVPLPIGCVILLFALFFELYYIQGYKDKVDAKLAQDEEASVSIEQIKDEANEDTLPAEAQDWRYKLMPLFPREALAVPNFLVFLLTTPLLFIGFMTFMTAEVEYWLYVERNTPLIAGLKMFPVSVGFFIGSFVNREDWIYKISMKWILVASQAVCIPMVAWIAQHDWRNPRSYWIYEFVPIVLYGFFTNTYMLTYINAVLRRTPPHLQGVVSGLLQTVAQIATCLGNAVTASLLGELYVSLTPEMKDALKIKFDHTVYLNYAALAAGVVTLLFLQDRRSVEDHAEEVEEAKDVVEESPISDESSPL